MRVTPPLLLALSLAAIGLLHRYFPIAQVIPEPWPWAGVVIALAGFALGGWTTSLFFGARTTLIPGRESAALITHGPFQFSRNPIYLGMVIVLIGACVFAGSLTPFAVVPIFILAIDTVVIPHEQAMLLQKFGAEYEAYRAKVRRWV
jgi:protein-S-isoprenylcysteine O-methyltransferase Ste14